MKNYSTLGVVLKRRNFSEADRVLTIFTKHHGKIVTLAKGIRKITSRKAPSLELFSYCKMQLVSGRNFEIITETELISSFPNLRNDLKAIAVGYQLCEVIDRLLPERQVNRSLFDMLITSFTEIDQSSENFSKKRLESMLLHILWDLGYIPANEVLTGEKLSFFLESILEKKLKSDQLLTKVEQLA